MDPMWAYQCIAQGGVPDPQLGCVPSAIYPAIRQCVNQGGTWEPYLGICIPSGSVPGAQAGWAETAARVACAAMGGQWDEASKSCGGPAVAKQYSLSELSAPASGGCPATSPVATPEGCRMWPTAVSPPTGRPTPTPGQVPVPGEKPSTPQTQPVAPSATSQQAEVSVMEKDWLVPVALIAGGLALYFFAR